MSHKVSDAINAPAQEQTMSHKVSDAITALHGATSVEYRDGCFYVVNPRHGPYPKCYDTDFKPVHHAGYDVAERMRAVEERLSRVRHNPGFSPDTAQMLDQFRSLGRDGFRAWLSSLDLATLQDIVSSISAGDEPPPPAPVAAPKAAGATSYPVILRTVVQRSGKEAFVGAEGTLTITPGEFVLTSNDGGVYRTASASKSREDPQEVTLHINPPVSGVVGVVLDLVDGTNYGISAPSY